MKLSPKFRPGRYYRRWNGRGEEFFVDGEGNLVPRALALTDLAEGPPIRVEEKAAAAADQPTIPDRLREACRGLTGSEREAEVLAEEFHKAAEEHCR